MKQEIYHILELYFCNDEVTTQECSDRLIVLFEENRINEDEILIKVDKSKIKSTIWKIEKAFNILPSQLDTLFKTHILNLKAWNY